MMSKLFNPIQESHDPLNRIVFLCKDANGFYVYKPANGFRSRHFKNEANEDCQACFERQVCCGHVHAFYEDGETPAEGEDFPLVDDEEDGTPAKQKVVKPKVTKPKVTKPKSR